MNQVETLTISAIESMPTPENLRINGPALAVLSYFYRQTYRPAVIRHVDEAYRLLERAGLRPGSRGSQAVPDFVMKLSPAMRGLVLSIWETGHPNLAIYPTSREQPENTVVYNTRVKRLHILLYDSRSDSFKIPDVVDTDYGPLFYCDERVVSVGVKRAAKRRDEGFGKFIQYRKDLWFKLCKLRQSNELVSGSLRIGEAQYMPSTLSKFSVSVGEKIDMTKPLPKSAFSMLGSEVFSGFAMQQFKPTTIASTRNVSPTLRLFSDTFSKRDPIVFNGEELPWA